MLLACLMDRVVLNETQAAMWMSSVEPQNVNTQGREYPECWKWLPDPSLVRTAPGRTLSLTHLLPIEKKEKKERSGRRRAGVGVWRRAEEWAALLESGGVKNQSDLARHLGVSRARVSEVLAVRSVHTDLQQVLLRAERAGTPVTDRLWRAVRRMDTSAALAALREKGFT